MIIIKDMEMPSGCDKCRGKCIEGYPYFCHMADKSFTEEESNKIDDVNFKPSWCPLEELKEQK